MAFKKKIEVKEEAPKEEVKVVTEKTEKEKLYDLLKLMKDYGFNSIGDIEVRISKL